MISPLSVPILRFDGEFEFLSNFFPSPIITQHGLTFPTVEHFFQAHKNPTDLEFFEKCRTAPTPGKAKRLGRQTQLRADWNGAKMVKIDTMISGLYMKFSQHADLQLKLRATWPARIVECNDWHDNFWGRCTCERCMQFMFQNKLGELLEMIRELARAGRLEWKKETTGLE